MTKKGRPIDYKKYDEKIHYCYLEELKRIVKENGYNYISEMIVKEYRKLKSCREVAEKMNRKRYFVMYHLKKLNEPRQPRGGFNNPGKYCFTKEEKKTILRLKKRGKTYSAIAKKYNVPHWAIVYVVERHKLLKEKKKY